MQTHASTNTHTRTHHICALYACTNHLTPSLWVRIWTVNDNNMHFAEKQHAFPVITCRWPPLFRCEWIGVHREKCVIIPDHKWNVWFFQYILVCVCARAPDWCLCFASTICHTGRRRRRRWNGENLLALMCWGRVRAKCTCVGTKCFAEIEMHDGVYARDTCEL